MNWMARVMIGAYLICCAGCSRAAPVARPGGSPAGEIVFYTNEGPDDLLGFRELIATFEAAHAEARIDLVNIADDAEFDKKLAALFAARTPPDVFGAVPSGAEVFAGEVKGTNGYRESQVERRAPTGGPKTEGE